MCSSDLELAPASCSAVLAQAKSEGWDVSKAAVEFLKVARGTNSLRAESSVVPPSVPRNSEEEERRESVRRMAEIIKKNRIRS